MIRWTTCGGALGEGNACRASERRPFGAWIVAALLVAACDLPADEGETSDVDPGSYCDETTAWPAASDALEAEVVALVNDARASGGDCGGEAFGPASPLRVENSLRCAARVHSLDMSERGFFDHTNPDGESPFDRMERAGYSYSAAAENIAAGYGTASQVVEGWLGSVGHCRNILNATYEEIGVGHVSGGQDGPYWTQTFGTPW